MKRLAGRVLLASFGIAAGLAMAEVAVRLLPIGPPAHDLRALHELRPDRPWLFGMRPGADVRGPGGVRYSVNADGFRDYRYARPKPPGTFRIVVLGCSIAFGWGVAMEDTFAKQLEVRLRALAPQPRFEVLNLSVSGYNPYTEGALFADVGVGYQPDLVLVEFCINDLNDPTLHFDAQTMQRLGPIPDAAFPNPQLRRSLPVASLSQRLCQYSRLCMLFADRPSFADPALLRAAVVPRDDPSPGELAWLRARYGAIASAERDVGGRFAVVISPHEPQVEGKMSDRLQARLTALGDDAGWPTIDLLPAFRAAKRAGVPLFLDAWHFTVAGHRVAADALLTELGCRGLLPLPPGPECREPSAPPPPP